jgi:hypothetical protein
LTSFGVLKLMRGKERREGLPGISKDSVARDSSVKDLQSRVHGAEAEEMLAKQARASLWEFQDCGHPKN